MNEQQSLFEQLQRILLDEDRRQAEEIRAEINDLRNEIADLNPEVFLASWCGKPFDLNSVSSFWTHQSGRTA